MPASAKTAKARPKRRQKPLRINLGLQGGGAHGAFTWGVLDRLFEDGRLEIEGIVGTSAGAMNAIATAAGLAAGGGEGARERLSAFWQAVSEAARRGPIQPSMLDRWLGSGNLDYSPSWHLFDSLSRVLSPYQANPLNCNPLKDILNDVIDFKTVRKSEIVKLFLCATNVRTGRIKVFMRNEISVDAVLASACLPYIYQAVEIDGEHYWDGGYMGNPPIFPLIYHTDASDVLIIQINPINIPDVPRTAQEIFDRINTLSFNSSLMREMRAIDFVTKLIDGGKLNTDSYKRLNIHTIDAEAEMAGLSVSSKLNADADFLQSLFELGRQRAESWLETHIDDVGVRSSTDIQAKFF